MDLDLDQEKQGRDKEGPTRAGNGERRPRERERSEQSGEYGETQRGVLSARPPLLNHLAAAAYGRLIHRLPQLPAEACSSSSSCPFFPSSLSSPSAVYFPSNLPRPNPYQLPLPCLLFNGSISQAFSQAPQPHPSRMLRLVMITPPVLSSFSAVNLKAAFRSNRLTCPSFLSRPYSPCSSFHPFSPSLNLDTLTWTTPSPKGGTPSASPPPRSAAIGGGDFAAS